MDADRVGDPAHDASQRIHLSGKLPLADATDCGIARHPAHRPGIQGNESRRGTHPSGGGGFHASMAATHNDDFKFPVHFHPEATLASVLYSSFFP